MKTTLKDTESGLEELDLVILGMEEQSDEARVQQILKKTPGIREARLIPEGAWIRYDPTVTDKEKICDIVKEAGFEANLFQDSRSGEARNVSQR